MKTIFFVVLFTALSCILHAQVKILTHEQAKAHGLNTAQLDAQYEERSSSIKPSTDNLKFYQDFAIKLNRIGRAVGNKKDRGTIWGKFYISKNGTFDYCIYSVVEGDIKPSILQHFEDSLRVFLGNYKIPVALKSNDSFNQAIYIGVFRQQMKGDSLISDIDDATATTRPDTVKILALNQLELENIPDVIYKFTNMEQLNLSGNLLKTASIDLTRLPKLKHIWLNNNRLTNDGLRLPTNKTLKILNLQGNNFTDIPATVHHCKRLESLWLGHNKLTSLTNQSFSNLKRLKDINFYSCEMASLPTGIGKLRRLEILDVYYNKLSVLPKQIGRLKKLQQAALSHNELSTFPTTFGKLRRLEKLYAHHNKLVELPTSVKRLKRLQTFDVGYNQFSTLPSQLRYLYNLEDIDASYNNLSEVPAVIIELPNLKKVFLRANPFAQEAALLDRSKPVLNTLTENNVEVFY